jgi:WD40 repeat protein/tRNA A-37 threonylcarbamoyl transferase component Bud32
LVAATSTGASVPGYDIIRELGRGGMGVVYQARQTKLNRLVALKMILTGSHAGAADLDRFQTEAEAIARLRHPNIVQIYEVGEHEGKPYFSLEFCGGGSLERKLDGTPLPPKEAAVLVETLARAMQAAHEQKVIHRDLKPANVLLAEDGTPKITDFGLAKKLDEAGQTQSGVIMGTPSYMAPEQAGYKPDAQARGPHKPDAQARGIGPAADVYALGAILYECLTGRPPFKAATAFDTVMQVVADEPVPPSQLQPKTPRDLETICLKCLRKEPGRRYESAAALADDLRRFVEARPIVARPVGRGERLAKWVWRNKVVSALTAAVALALVAGAAVSGYFAYTASVEAKAARRAEKDAQDRATAEAEAKRIAQGETTRADAEKRRAEQQLRRAEGLVYTGKLSLAHSALAEGNGALALLHLDQCQWDRRGWEHRHLWTRLSSKQTLLGHTDHVSSVAISPDGQRILTGSGDKTAMVWDARTGQELLSLKGHTDGVTSVAFSPDGKRLLTGSHDRTAKVWDAANGQEVLTLKGHDSGVLGVAWSPDGQRILTAGDRDHTARVWDSQKGQEVIALQGHTQSVFSAAFSPDGKRIVTGSGGSGPQGAPVPGEAKVWDAEKGREVLALKGHTDQVRSVAWSPDGRRILTGSTDKTARVWDAEKGHEVLSLTGHTSWVLGVAFSPDGQRILTGSMDSTAKVWDAVKGRELLSLKSDSWFASVAFSPDGRRIVNASGHTAQVWDAEKGQEVLALKGHTQPLTGVAWSPDGQRIATGCGGFDLDRNPLPGEVKVWDAKQGYELFSLKGRTGSVLSVAFSPDGKRIVTGCHDDTARVWDAEKGREVLTLKGHTGCVWSVAFSPDGQRILTGSHDFSAKVWGAANGQELFPLRGRTGVVLSVAFSADGQRILTGSSDDTAKVWDVADGQELLALKGHTSSVNGVAFSRDGKRILTGSQDRTAKVWDAVNGREILTLEGHTSAVTSVAFSGDGKRLLTGSEDGTARLWDAETGQEVFALKGHTGGVASAAFSPDGKRILTGSADRTAMVWDADKTRAELVLQAPRQRFDSVAFSADGKQLFAWDTDQQLLAWSTVTGQRVDPVDPPPKPPAGPARSPDGFLRAEPRGSDLAVTDTRRVIDPTANHWPLPDRAERIRYHSEQAARAEKEKHWFAAAFHLGRLLLDSPDDADLKRRHELALKNHAAAAPRPENDRWGW